ncbi:MAG: hypothetical protein HONBIEJF_02402 [Fimbriimonadaceae bacterium]|nr:hypothetical protein [Fimbriimonadaceae bacterium]
MRSKPILAITIGGIAAVVLAQTSGTGASLLKAVGDKLFKAESLQSTYTVTRLGGTSQEYTVALSKPNKLRLESSDSLTVADGTTITIYDKKGKTYFKRAQSDAELKGLLASEATQLWSAFFAEKQFDNGYNAKAMPDKVRKGTKFKVLEVTAKDSADAKWTLYVDPADSLVKQAELSVAGKESDTMVYDVKSIAAAAGADLFAFKAPEGSKEVKEEDLISDRWYYSLAEGKDVAKKTKRILLVDFYADW